MAEPALELVTVNHRLHGNRAADAFLSLSQSQRRLAHRAKREALAAEAEGKLHWYRHFRSESDRLWKSAWWNLRQARYWRHA